MPVLRELTDAGMPSINLVTNALRLRLHDPGRVIPDGPAGITAGLLPRRRLADPTSGITCVQNFPEILIIERGRLVLGLDVHGNVLCVLFNCNLTWALGSIVQVNFMSPQRSASLNLLGLRNCAQKIIYYVR